MKKFNFRKVLDGLTASSPGSASGTSTCPGGTAGVPAVGVPPKETEVQETLASENFQICKTVRHGFPYQPTALAFDPVQKIVAIGTRTGGVRILGRPGVDCYCQHDSEAAVLQLQFPINEGALVTACADDTLHLWNLRQKRPAILHSLKFNRERATKTHPGPVVHLSDSPRDEGKMLIGFESGTVVLWDLRAKKPDFRFYYDEAIHSVSWHHEGKQFMCSHSDGSLTMWNLKNTAKPFQITFPHEFQEPYAVVVLLEKDFIVVDLTQSHFPIFENPYPMDIHESPVTCTAYFADCPPELIPALYSVGAKHKKQGYSNKEWPVSGGTWTLGAQTYPEIIITGHADGSIKFWDGSAITLEMLYKLKTSKVFEKQKVGEGKQVAEIVEEDPYAIQMISWCPESRILCVTGISAHVILYRFSKHEATTEIVSLEVRLQNDVEDIITPEATENISPYTEPSQPITGSPSNVSPEGIKDSIPCLKYECITVKGEVSPSKNAPRLPGRTAVVDFIQKTVLLSMGTIDLYGSSDPYPRQLRSPRRSKQLPAGPYDLVMPLSFDSTCSLYIFFSGLSELSDSPVSLELERCKSPTSESRDNSFSRSRSSSVSSIDKESKETITALYFMDSYGRKNDGTLSPCLWVGTSLGVVLVISLNLPSGEEQRQSEPVMVAPSGTVLMLKGAVLTFSSVDCAGGLIHPPYEVWRDPNSMDDNEKPRKRKLVTFSPSSSQDMGDYHFAVICSEKQAKVYSLPSQNCLYAHSITESSFVLRADVVTVCNSVCLACFCANGHIMTLSLPSLRPMLDVNYLPLTDMRIARTFCFTNGGQALFLSSPTEVQRITFSQEMCENLQLMLKCKDKKWYQL
ncbi:Syntaxin-binding protein 5-like [Acipenser ruthenus]|uniref:Syntaxin-binding protein 5-like n=1 Tax=Acipenser ruthenus TaxID=7906 RepID=A0A444UL05_ACIRT|nr:Syntaxin-binding protein 5-like [Acipenser ruthenus]